MTRFERKSLRRGRKIADGRKWAGKLVLRRTASTHLGRNGITIITVIQLQMAGDKCAITRRQSKQLSNTLHSRVAANRRFPSHDDQVSSHRDEHGDALAQSTKLRGEGLGRR